MPSSPPTPTSPTAWGAWGSDVRDDPFAHLGRARASCPVQPARLPDGHDAWVVLDHEAARHALRDDRLSKDMLAALARDGDVVAEGLPGPDFARHLLAVDPPDHTRLRRLIGVGLSPRRVAGLEPAIHWRVATLLDQLEARAADGPVDLVDAFAHPLPFGVIGDLIGIPDEDHDHLRRWFRTLLTPGDGEPSPEVVAASGSIVDYLHHLVAAKRARPGDDLVSVLLDAQRSGDALDDQELLSTLFQLIVAGHDTTTSLLGNSVVALLDHPDQLAAVRREPELLPGAVEELVRFTAPVPHATFRVTTEPVDLGAVEVPADAQVLVCLAAANRDPAVFEDPDRLDVRRSATGHVGFGHGIHHCLGAPLARLEARIALGSLFARFPDLRLAVPRGDLHWSRGDGLVLRGLHDLPVHLQP